MKQKYNDIEAKDNMRVVETEEVVDKKKHKQIIENEPVKLKRGLGSRLVTGILGPEGISGIGSYVNNEIIVPAIKNIIVDAVTSGINMVMYGENRKQGSYNPYQGRSPGTYRPGTNYTSRYTSQQSKPEPAERYVNPRSRQSVEEYIIEDRFGASSVLTTLTESADMYGQVSVADYYDLIGVPSSYTDNNYGWSIESLSQATILPIRGGYLIKFPPVEVL